MKSGTKRVQLTEAQVKVVTKALKSTERAYVFTEKETRQAGIVLLKLTGKGL